MNKNIRLLVEGLFDDIYDLNNDINDVMELGDEMYNKLPLDSNLQAQVSKLLNITKPAGFKLYNHTSTEYEKYMLTASYYQWNPSRYLTRFLNLIESSDWKKYQLIENYKEISLNEIKEEFIKNIINKYQNDNNKIYYLYVSPDETLIFLKRLQKNINTYEYILTFSGKLFITLSQKDSKEQLKQAKLLNKKIKYFRWFIEKNNNLTNLKLYAVKQDASNNQLYLYINLNNYSLFQNNYKSFKNAKRIYKEITPTDPDVIYEFSSVFNDYSTIQFINDKNHKYSNNDYIIKICLTEAGEKKFYEMHPFLL